MSQFRKNRSINWRKIIFVIILLFVVWFLFSWVKKFRGLGAPIYSDVASLTLLSKQSLIKKVAELQSSLDAQNASLTSLSALEKENESLKKELGREGFIKGTLARVIVPPNRSIYDTLVIDIGSKSGVSVGQHVYAFGSIALGTISEVSENSSTVLLYSSPNRETVGSVTGSELNITLIGRGSGEYEVRMPRDIAFNEGDIITDQSLSLHPLASIQKIVTDPRDPFQRLLAKAPVNLQTLKWVVVK
jgi:hypothetical protein